MKHEGEPGKGTWSIYVLHKANEKWFEVTKRLHTPHRAHLHALARAHKVAAAQPTSLQSVSVIICAVVHVHTDTCTHVHVHATIYVLHKANEKWFEVH